MPLAKQRSVIGGSNRRTVTSAPSHPRPQRSPFNGKVLHPDLHPSSSADTINSNEYEARRRAPRDMKHSVSRDRLEVERSQWLEEAKRPHRPGSAHTMRSTFEEAEPSTGSASTLSGQQEYALGVMTDFFATRPLEQMRNAFRDADKDGSGELDLAEFQLAVRNMGSKLTDKDAKALFAIADEDRSGTLGIDEFFINFRHDQWPRERFFWSKQCGGDKTLNRDDRHALNAKLNVDQQLPAKKSTADIMKVLAEKVAVKGSAEKVFRVLDTNLNGSLDVSEIAEAIRPFEIDVDDKQAAEVLAEINRIAGKDRLDADLEYHNFAASFNSSLPPERMGSIAFQPPRSSDIVRRRQPIDADPKALGEVRSLESIPSAIETVSHMASLSTLPIAPPLDKTAFRAPRSDQEREAQQQGAARYDQMSGWRGETGSGHDYGGLMGKEIMKVGRDIDWTVDNANRPPPSLYESATKVNSGASMPQRSASRSMPNLTPLERPATGALGDDKENTSGGGGGAAASSGPDKSDSQKKLHWALGDPSELQRAFSLNTHDGKYSSGQLSNSTTRSRLALAHELAGSRSTLECLYPGRASHHHTDDAERFRHTSSIASLRSISGNARPLQDPRVTEEVEWRKIKIRERGERDAERDSTHQLRNQAFDNKVAAILDARTRVKASLDRRRGERQLCFLTRDMENGKAPIVVEAPARPGWGGAPPHMTSHWRTIAGHLTDPPPRVNAGVASVYGRRSFPERGNTPDGRPGLVSWGGSHQAL